DFNKWANKPENKAKYGEVIAKINAYYAATNEKARHDNYLIGMLRTSDFAALPYSLGRALEQYAGMPEAARAEMGSQLQEYIDEAYKAMYIPIEKDVLAAQLNLYATKSGGYPIASHVAELAKANNNDFTKYVNDAFAKSIFASKENVEAFLKNPNAEALQADPLYILSADLLKQYRYKPENIAELENDYQKSFRLLVEG